MINELYVLQVVLFIFFVGKCSIGIFFHSFFRRNSISWNDCITYTYLSFYIVEIVQKNNKLAILAQWHILNSLSTMNGVVRTHFDASMLYLIRIYRSGICFSHLLLLKLALKRFRQNEIPFVPLSQVYQHRCNMHQINMIITCESGLENVIETMRSEGCHLKSKQLLPKKKHLSALCRQSQEIKHNENSWKNHT